jgi:micrococcal nuclease
MSVVDAMLAYVSPLAVLPLSLLLAACGQFDRATSPPPQPVAPGSRAEATVTRVVDGDTIHVLLDGVDTTIRFIGVDTPETVAPGQPMECYGPEASNFATARLTGRVVDLEFDRELIDPYGRTLAYAWLDGRLFDETLVRRGFAEAKAYRPNTAHQAQFDAAEASARDSGRGLWGACPAPEA